MTNGINFSGLPETTHQCTAHKNGDYIIWTCPQCDYKRKYNWKNGKMIFLYKPENCPNHVGGAVGLDGTDNLSALTNIKNNN